MICTILAHPSHILLYTAWHFEVKDHSPNPPSRCFSCPQFRYIMRYLIGKIIVCLTQSLFFLNFTSSPHLLLTVVSFLKALWEGGNQYIHVLDKIRSSEMFWKHLSSCMLATQTKNDLLEKNLNNDEMDWSSFRYLRKHAFRKFW